MKAPESLIADYLSLVVEELTRMAQDPRQSIRGVAERHPNTPPMVRLYLQSEGYSSMTLQEFLEAAK
jgi:hypothetical protein